MALPDDVLADFEQQAMYDRSAWFVDEVLEIVPETHTVRALMHTTHLPFVDAQRDLPGHPRHVPAAIAIQATGTLGLLYATYVLGLRATDGWSGFGTKIEGARWGSLARIGPPVEMRCTCVKTRELRGTRFCWFGFEFVQEDAWVYRSRQSAAWRRVAPA
ncbi:MAG: hypothetical protein KC656_27500 [Myxococcales bacterium]|nr:hypothetical protein [Myxococcales bacterium]